MPDMMEEMAYHLSPYRYAFNNPIRVIDPDGNYEWILDSDLAAIDVIYDASGNYNTGSARKEFETQLQQSFVERDKKKNNNQSEGAQTETDPPKKAANGEETFSFLDEAPKQDFSGFWGRVKYVWTCGNIDGFSYNWDGKATGLAPIMGIAPTPGFAKGVKVLQTGGHVLKPATLKGLNLTKQQGKTAIESMKKANGLRNDFHGKILNNGDVLDDLGNYIDNLLDYLH